jgi:hypothetical protein
MLDLAANPFMQTKEGENSLDLACSIPSRVLIGQIVLLMKE